MLSLTRRLGFCGLLLYFGALPLAAQSSLHFQAKQFKGLQWRQIGPFRGGRVLAVTGVPGHPRTFYFGAVSGGVWKTTDAGISWQPLFQHQKVSSIGAIAVAPSDPNVVYVGTGESCPRGDLSFGDGMYKSVDGGKTWKHIGLNDTRHIAAIIVDPQNPDRVFVAALGHVFGPNSERGIYRSLDGGKTWQRVLYKDDNTGGDDVVFDPQNPHILFAALWQVRRTPWGFSSGGPGSGLYKSLDGGDTWQPVSGHGFPAGVLGKIGVAVAANGERVYAQIEAKKGGFYVSNDQGKHWTRVNANHNLRQRAWYFTHVIADPRNTNTVYVLNTSVMRSTDGGRNFTPMPVPHGDNHGLWIAPRHTARMIAGNDGGAAVSLDGGKTWSSQNNQPTAQFYHVATDNRFHYYLYGAQQDNSTVAIPSRTDHGVITRADWYDVGGGESGFVVPDPSNPQIVYAGSYDGLITRYNHANGQEQDVTPWPDNPMGAGASKLKYRFQWTAPIMISPFPPHALYFGAQVLFRSIDGGQNWQVISPDLTRNDKSKQHSAGGPITQDNTSVEYYDTLFAVAESPLKQGEIWAGSDDGLIHLTRNRGKSWANVTPSQLPAWTKISQIAPSPFSPAVAYIAANRRKLGDLRPMLYKTTNYGNSWEEIDAGLPADAVTHSICADPVRRGLLFAGTEIGVFASFDDGEHWSPLQLNLPTAPVRDLLVHGNDLVAATHGRAFWILDNITPLRQLQQSDLNSFAWLYAPAVAYRQRGGGFFMRHYAAMGVNPPAGAVIDYQLKGKPKTAITLAIYDSHGQPIDNYVSKNKKGPAGRGGFFFGGGAPALPAKPGLNRFVWNLRYPAPKRIPGEVTWGFPQGAWVLPGNYQVKLTAAGKTFTAPLEVRLDPRVHATPAQLAQQLALMQQINRQVAAAHAAVIHMQSLQRQLSMLNQRLAGDAGAKPVAKDAQALSKQLGQVIAAIAQLKSKSGEDALNYRIKLDAKLENLAGTVESADTAPTAASYAVYRRLSGELGTQLAVMHQLENRNLAQLNRQIAHDHIPMIGLPARKSKGRHLRPAASGKR